jgi:hypothetical protein
MVAMPDWLKEKADQIKQEEGARKGERERLARIKAQAPEVCAAVATTTERLVTEFNETFRSKPRKQLEFERVPPHGFFVRKPSYPGLVLETWLDLDAQEYHYSLSGAVGKDSPVRTQGTLVLHLDEAGQLQLKSMMKTLNTEEVARFLLEPMLSALRL